VSRGLRTRDYAALSAAVDEGVRELGRLDFVLADAGILSFGPSAELSSETWNDTLGINLTGDWHAAKAAIPHLRAAAGGSIVITSSGAGIKAFPDIAHYSANKYGVVGLMMALAKELVADGIRVNSVHPTGVDTLMVQNAFNCRIFAPDKQGSPDPLGLRRAQHASDLIPFPGMNRPDVSAAVGFLCSDEARYITGIKLPVDAGSMIL